MTANTNMRDAGTAQDTSRHLDTPEFIDRLAEKLRHSSGIDLPHAYFVEQVKLKLAGSPAFDASLGEAAPEAANKPLPDYQSSACFTAWAIPD
ncbi:hypothetical protein DEM27_04175 [Metarhizobium album]|uniref:Uncharacterized protein n=1 Tax=Metarhizobium album TaxID=2182425 RepID=A0A2U2DU62_9HYPH|nr:hypothetical protein [Rhizobium album]OJU06397.1 MAG: hypothetical protein BGN83_22280 [Rhizobium sp. 63-7]PWE56853.1 hypothetical protein DEM27_04175 [Rhizobium album]